MSQALYRILLNKNNLPDVKRFNIIKKINSAAEFNLLRRGRGSKSNLDIQCSGE